MHDFDLEATTHALPRTPERDKSGPDHDHGPSPATRSGVHDVASLMQLQRMVGNAGVVQLLADDSSEETSPVHDVVGKGGGTPLDDSTRESMEGKFGQSFSDVRVHTDEAASASAESVGANAYTVGSDIVFNAGQFDAGSPTGQRTLAHELTHVVQQRSGPVDGTDAPGGIKLSDPSDRFEQAAEETASQMVSTASAASPASADTAQRDLEEEAAAVQTTLQRQAPEEEEEEEVPA